MRLDKFLADMGLWQPQRSQRIDQKRNDRSQWTSGEKR